MRRTHWLLTLLGLAMAAGCAWGEAAGAGPEVIGTIPCALSLGPARIEAAPPATPPAPATAATKATDEGAPEAKPQYVPYLMTVFAPRPPGPYRERVVKMARLTQADLRTVQKAADPAAALATLLGLTYASDPTPHPEEIPQRQMLVNLLLKMRSPQALISFDEQAQPQGSVSLGDNRLLGEAMKRDWQGVAGFVRNTRGDPLAALDVRLKDAPTKAEQVVTTTLSGYFEFTSPAQEGTLVVRGTEYSVKWGAGQRQFVNLVVPLDDTKGFPDDAATMAPPGAGALDSSGIVDVWSSLGGLPSPLTQALQMAAGRLPVMGGVTWSPRSHMRAYYGLEQQLGQNVFDRGARLAAYGDLIVEIVEYAPEWSVPTPGASEAEAAAIETKAILLETQQDEAAVRYQLRFARAKRQEVVSQDPPNADGVEQVKGYTQQIEELGARLPYLQQRRRTAEAQSAYYAALAEQAASGSLGSFQQAGAKTAQQREIFDRARAALETARQTASGVEGLPGLSEPDLAAKLAGSSDGPPALLGEASMRSLRLTVASLLEPESLEFARRRQPGNYGLTVGVALGGDAGSDSAEAAYGAWYRLGRRFDLKLMAGQTVGSGGNGAEFLGGLMFSLPVGRSAE